MSAESGAGDGTPSTPSTILLVHGFWVTPRSWENWIDHYAKQGYTVIAPAYPGLEVEVEALREDPSPIAELTIPAILERFEQAIAGLDEEPIIIGHSAGGVFTQLLLDRGHGAAAVVLNSAPTEGVKVVPLSQIRSTFEVLKNPANRHRAVAFSEEQWKYAFGNTLSEEESRELYEKYAIAAPGRIVWQSVLANVEPGHQDSWVDYKNPDRAPLLFLSGGEDHIMPPSVQASNAKHYKAEGTDHRARDLRGPRPPDGRRDRLEGDRRLGAAVGGQAREVGEHLERGPLDPYLRGNRRADLGSGRLPRMPPNLKVKPDGTLAAWSPPPTLPPRRKVIERFLPSSPFPGKLGLELVELGEDRAELRLPFDPANATMGDVVHGGAIATLIDTAGMAAAWSDEEAPRSLGGATSTISVDYLAPASGTDLTAVATVARRAKRLCFVTVEVLDPERRAIATGAVVHRYI